MRLADTSLDYALKRLASMSNKLYEHKTLRQHIPTVLPELRDILNLLEYHSTPQSGIDPPIETFFGPQPHCQHDGCMKTWKDHDACLLHLNGKWLCRDHHPPLSDGGIRPPGYQPPSQARADLEAARNSVRGKLTREEMRLINTRKATNQL